MSIQVTIVALYFTVCGVFSFIWPNRVFSQFGVTIATADGRNEVRGTYGGMCMAIAAMLFSAPLLGDFAAGAVFGLAVACFGMAAGRIGALALERAGAAPLLYLALELACAVLLLSTLDMTFFTGSKP